MKPSSTNIIEHKGRYVCLEIFTQIEFGIISFGLVCPKTNICEVVEFFDKNRKSFNIINIPIKSQGAEVWG